MSDWSAGPESAETAGMPSSFWRGSLRSRAIPLPEKRFTLSAAAPDPDGRIPAPLAARFAEIGARVSFPAPLTELPAGWLQR